MKTIMSVDTVTIRVNKSELFDNKWIPFTLVSKKLMEIEKKENDGIKNYRSKLHNSCACGKYNIGVIAGIKCINVDDPMAGDASLVLSFKRG